MHNSLIHAVRVAPIKEQLNNIIGNFFGFLELYRRMGAFLLRTKDVSKL